MKKTLVIGASENPDRYSYMAIEKLRKYAHPVVAIGRKKGKVKDVSFDTHKEMFEDIDTITLYLNPKNQQEYYDYILSLKPKRIIFNPGTENSELEKIVAAQNINTIEACTLVLLSTGQY
ncbi:MAG: CoA-binding protein [Bacteroidetes bacterium]|nr:CoA-binding protein [Bacteroidota bacterium]